MVEGLYGRFVKNKETKQSFYVCDKLYSDSHTRYMLCDVDRNLQLVRADILVEQYALWPPQTGWSDVEVSDK